MGQLLHATLKWSQKPASTSDKIWRYRHPRAAIFAVNQESIDAVRCAEDFRRMCAELLQSMRKGTFMGDLSIGAQLLQTVDPLTGKGSR